MRILIPDQVGEANLKRLSDEFPDVSLSLLSIVGHRPLVFRMAAALLKRMLPFPLYLKIQPVVERERRIFLVDGQRLNESLNGIDVLVVNWALDHLAIKQLVAALPNLRWVHSLVTGVDHIDLKDLAEKGISLTSPRAVHAKRIAEFVNALIVSDAKNLFEHFEATRERRPKFMSSRELSSIVVGIVGFGAIGQEVARLALRLGMGVKAVCRSSNPNVQVEGVELCRNAESLLPKVDVLVLALPLTSATQGLIGSVQLQLLRPGAMLVNVGRGGTVNQDALIDALKSGRLRRACIDVVEDPVTGRPAFALPPNHPIYGLKNVIFTSYSSSESANSSEELFGDFLENLSCYVENKPLKTPVNLDIGY